MGYYLIDNGSRIPQGRTPRRAKLSGMVGVHTSEGVMDSVGVDTGAENVASFITPVPGGVGPMTITMLLANTLESAERAANA